MIQTLVPVRRIAALSVAITLFAAPIASAQTPAPASTSDAPVNTAPPVATPVNTALLSSAAFARLVQPPPVVAPAPVVKNTPRLDLLHHGTTAIARQAQAAPTKAPQQRSWVSRHQGLTALFIGVGALFGIMGILVAAGWGE